jgi:ABC-type multidrug transport system ATPase subunit
VSLKETVPPSAPPTPAVAAPAVEAEGVCRRYGRRWALVNVDLSLPRGSSLVVAGRNGSGKSTLFRVLSTLIRPDRGVTRIHGLDPRDDLVAARRKVALLSHHSNHHEALTALENLEVAARFLGRPARREALLPRLAEVGLAERADDPVQTFSAGMRKRLTIARTLLQEAEVVFLDEPYGQLDPPGFRLVDDIVAGLRARGATVLVATHQLERGASLCERGLVLEAGRVAWTGHARELARGSGLDAAGLAEAGA